MDHIVSRAADRGGAAAFAWEAHVKMPDFVYHRPESMDVALALLAAQSPDAKVLAGGQSLMPIMALRLSQPAHLVDIGRIPSLRTLEEAPDGGLVIGATVRHEDVERSGLVARRAPLLAEAIRLVGHPAIRSRGTVCGSLAHADASAELPALALALDAQLVAVSVRGERVIPASEFFTGFLSTALAPDEILTQVRLPAWPAGAWGAVREVSRRHGDFALVGLVAALTVDGGGGGKGRTVDSGGTVTRAALSYFGVASTPVRASAAEQVLVGRRVGDPATVDAVVEAVTSELDPGEDIHATAAYRRYVAGQLTRQVLTAAPSGPAVLADLSAGGAA